MKAVSFTDLGIPVTTVPLTLYEPYSRLCAILSVFFPFPDKDSPKRQGGSGSLGRGPYEDNQGINSKSGSYAPQPASTSVSMLGSLPVNRWVPRD